VDRKFMFAMLLAGLLLVPGSTAAGQAPPDNSGLDQYIEDTPGAGGDQQGGGGGSGDPKDLPEQSTSALESQPGGAAALDLAARTAPGGGDNSHGDKGGKGGDGAKDAPHSTAAPTDSDSGVSSVVSEVTGGADSGGMGLALPIILAAALVGALVVVVTRRLQGGEHSERT
jgi:hypothetical protein